MRAHVVMLFGIAFGRVSLLVSRGLRVYPYPRVYPTRPVPAGTGRVGYMLHGYGLGRVALRVRVYPFLPVKNNKMCIATLQVVVKVRHT